MQRETIVKVHVFFAAAGVQGSDKNDVLIHGLRGSSNQSEWITIAVQGILSGANPISDNDIQNCLKSIGINDSPVALRLTGHSRGADSLVASLIQKKIKDLSLIERIVILDEAVEHDQAGAIKINRVSMLKRLGIPASKIIAYEVGTKSIDTAANKSVKDPQATYHDLNPGCMAAIGYVRLIKDAMALQPAIASLITGNAAIQDQVTSLPLPPRGTFTTGTPSGQEVSIQQFCKDNSAAINKILSTDSNPHTSLLTFINRNNLTHFSGFQWNRGLAAHQFFVAEIANELTN